jgi:predicted TIM-barrel fold metal-dependent hydrolase
MIDGLRICDADAHVVEPGGLFDAWCPDGAPMELPETTPFEPCGDLQAVADQLEHGFDAPSYLRAMDVQGIDAAVLYPSIGLFVPFQPELSAEESAAACRAYNDWLADYCATDPARLAGIALVPYADPGAAAAEVGRVADLGLVGALVRPNHLFGRSLGDLAYTPLYEALADRGLVLAVHEGLGLRGPTIGSDRYQGFATRHACSHPLEQMAAMAGLMLEGVLERHPDLRVAFLESGTGWLPYWLHRLDEHREWMEDSECAALQRSPSEYFRDQCVISSEADDALAPGVVEAVGADHVLWASDFPHPDAIYPGAPQAFLDNLDAAGTPRPKAERVLWETPLSFYRLHDRFSPR